jgi:hypothetical protein
MKIASFIVPHTGGTWTAALVCTTVWPHRIAVRLWRGRAATAWEDPTLARYRPFVDLIAAHETSRGIEAAALLEFLLAAGYDGVIIDVLSDPVPASLVRHLPASLIRVMVVHSITPGTYAVARRIAPFAHATVVVSPRMKHDLRGGPGLSDQRIHLIPHGLPPEAFEPSGIERRSGALRWRSWVGSKTRPRASSSSPRSSAEPGAPIRVSIAGMAATSPNSRLAARAFPCRSPFSERLSGRESVKW